MICQTSSKVDQLQAHPPNNGAGWGDRDPAPNAPVADHLPPKLPEQMQESESSCAHRVEQQRQVQRATIPAPVSIWCNRSPPVWHLSPPKMFWPIFAAAKSNCIKGKSSGQNQQYWMQFCLTKLSIFYSFMKIIRELDDDGKIWKDLY